MQNMVYYQSIDGRNNSVAFQLYEQNRRQLKIDHDFLKCLINVGDQEKLFI